MNALKCALLCFAVLFASGCLTDELVVYEKGLLTPEEMKPLLGAHELTELRSGSDGKAMPFEKGRLAVEKKGDKYHFSLEIDYKNGSEKYAGPFLLSRIPESKSKLLVLAIPDCTSKPRDGDKLDLKNVFLLVKREGDQTYAWLVLNERPVAKGKIASAGQGGFKADQVKSFLEKHADAYVKANKAVMGFKKAD